MSDPILEQNRESTLFASRRRQPSWGWWFRRPIAFGTTVWRVTHHRARIFHLGIIDVWRKL